MINDVLGLGNVGNTGQWRGQILDIEARPAWEAVRARCVSLGLSMATQLPLNIRFTKANRSTGEDSASCGPQTNAGVSGRPSRRASCD